MHPDPISILLHGPAHAVCIIPIIGHIKPSLKIYRARATKKVYLFDEVERRTPGFWDIDEYEPYTSPCIHHEDRYPKDEMIRMSYRHFLAGWMIAVWVCLPSAIASDVYNGSSKALHQALKPLIGTKDSVMVASPDGAPLVAIHADRLLVPASILKLITVSAALDQLGEDYRFKTEFYQDDQHNLIVKGYGDPLLISERMTTIATALAGKLTSFQRLVLDDSFF